MEFRMNMLSFPSYRLSAECKEDIRKCFIMSDVEEGNNITIYYLRDWEKELLSAYLSHTRNYYSRLPKLSSIVDTLNKYREDGKFEYYFTNFMRALKEDKNYYFCRFDEHIPSKWQVEMALNKFNVSESTVKFYLSYSADSFNLDEVLNMRIEDLVSFFKTDGMVYADPEYYNKEEL